MRTARIATSRREGVYSYLAKCLEGIGRVVAQHKSIRDRLHTRDGMWFGSQLATAMLYRLWLLGKFMYHRQHGLAALMQPTGKSQGFTLVELMVTVAVLAILVAVAVPSFASISNRNRLSALANDVVSSLQTARMEALRRGQRVVLCRSSDGATCSTGNPWNGWIVFTDADGNNAPGSGDILRADLLRGPSQVWVSPIVSSGGDRVVFSPDAMAYSNGGLLLQARFAACIETTTPRENVSDISIASGSRVSVSRRNAAGQCAAPANL